MLAAVVAVSGLKERNRREEVGEGEFQDARTHASKCRVFDASF